MTTATAKETTKATASPNGEQAEGQTIDVGKTLAAKLANVAREIDRVAKRGRNREQNYTFAAAGDIFDEIRGKLAAQKVALRWSIDRENTHLDAVESKGGAKGLFATLWITYTFVDGENGTEFAYYTVGTANDYPGDKAVYKAQTNALKYLLTQTFLVSTGDDVEADGRHTEDTSATYQPRNGGRYQASAEAARSAPSPSSPHLTPEQTAELTALNASLPKPVDEKPLSVLLRDLPYDTARNSLGLKHQQQCGPDCGHLAKP